MATPISCEAEHCQNLAKYAVSDYPTLTTGELKSIAVCGLHLRVGFQMLQSTHPLYLVGEIDNHAKA